jgi:GntR family transcriptional regulator/MocR family aminotransferase
MTSLGQKQGTTSGEGPQLLIELRGRRRRAQLEDRLRGMIRDGALAAGERLPSTRALAGDLGVSRRLVVDAYSQLLAEGYLVAEHGAGTYVAGADALSEVAQPQAAERLRYDFFPGNPDLASFPRALWLRAVREVLRTAPAHAFGYPDPSGAIELRTALAGHLRRVRGVVADPQAIVITSGITQGLAVISRVLLQLGGDRIAVEDPGLPPHRAVLAAAGLRVTGTPVDRHGIAVESIDAPAVVVTPAHHLPTGVAMSAPRRAQLIEWARAGNLVIEDDYDAEFRYDRAPLAALQGLAPGHVVHMGTVSKTLAPALRLGWMVVPPRLLEQAVEAKLLHDFGTPTIEQLALARLIDTAAYDRELRRARRRNRARRDALIAAVAESLPRGARVEGVAAGLHGLVRLPRPVDAAKLVIEARRRSVGVYPLSFHMIAPPPQTDALVLGYANVPEPAIAAGIRLLAEALAAAERS